MMPNGADSSSPDSYGAETSCPIPVMGIYYTNGRGEARVRYGEDLGTKIWVTA